MIRLIWKGTSMIIIIFLFAGLPFILGAGGDSDLGYAREFYTNVKTDVINIYRLVTSLSPEGGGSVTPASGTYDQGTVVTIMASPQNGYRFNHWEGDASTVFSTISITMDSDKAVTAFFTQWSVPFIPMPPPLPPEEPDEPLQ